MRVLDAAVDHAYGGKKRIHWAEIYAGQKSSELFNSWLPDETVQAGREYLVSIKGPLTTPLGGGCKGTGFRGSHASSPRTAGQLLDVPGEGLGRELQALDHGQVGEQLLGELIDRHAVVDGECGGLDQFARL